MPAGRVRIDRFARPAAVLAVLAAVAACASDRAAPGPSAALFRTQVGHASEAVAPGLRSAWYVQHQPVRYAKSGLAGWGPADSGLGARLARLFGGAAARGALPAAVAALDLELPVPSVIEVTNLRTFKTVAVRVDNKARLHGQILRLPADAAQALGADPTQPLAVRLSYAAPVFGFREPPTLREALRGPTRREPAAAPPVLLATQAKPPPIVVAPQQPPEPPPLRLALAPQIAPERAPKLRGELGASSAVFIQAGAFARRANAERALGLLADAGRADIWPIRRGGQTFYRVVLAAPGDAASAEQLRARIAGIGFTGARLIGPL